MNFSVVLQLFPIAASLRGYTRADFNQDLTAGLVLAVLTVPQGLAYAYLAGLPPQAGLYASLAPAVVYACMGSSRELIVGPVAVAALLVAATVGEFTAAGRGSWTEITAVLTAECGIALLALFAVRGGGIVNLLPGPVITGFVNAAAVLIILNQVDDMLGLEVTAHDPAEQLSALAGNFDQLHATTAIITASALAILLVFRLGLLDRLAPRLPVARLGPIVAVAATTTAVVVMELGGAGVATVGPVPAGLPPLTLPTGDLRLWIDLAPAAGVITLIAFVESYSIGANLAARRRRRIRPPQELLALGAANLTSAVSGGYPVAGSFTRSSVNFTSGARTQLSAIICAAMVLLTVLFLTDLFEPLPNAVLAVIIVMSVISLIEISPLGRLWRYSRRELLVNLVTFIGVLVLGIEVGLIGGILLGLSLLVLRGSRPHMVELGRIGTTAHFRSLRNYPDEARREPLLLIIRIDEDLQFTNVRAVERFLVRVLEKRADEVRHVIFACSSVNFIDSSGLQMLERLADELQALDIQLHLADVKFPVKRRLLNAGLPDDLSGKRFFSTDDAVRALSNPQASNSHREEDTP